MKIFLDFGSSGTELKSSSEPAKKLRNSKLSHLFSFIFSRIREFFTRSLNQSKKMEESNKFLIIDAKNSLHFIVENGQLLLEDLENVEEIFEKDRKALQKPVKMDVNYLQRKNLYLNYKKDFVSHLQESTLLIENFKVEEQGEWKKKKEILAKKIGEVAKRLEDSAEHYFNNERRNLECIAISKTSTETKQGNLEEIKEALKKEKEKIEIEPDSTIKRDYEALILSINKALLIVEKGIEIEVDFSSYLTDDFFALEMYKWQKNCLWTSLQTETSSFEEIIKKSTEIDQSVEGLERSLNQLSEELNKLL